MLRELNVSERRFPLVAPFRIARGVKYAADVVTVELQQAGRTGRGESVPYARYGESMASVLDEIESLRAELAAGMGRDELQLRLPPGAARNALDAAMWDLDSQLSAVPVWVQLGQPPRTTLRSVTPLPMRCRIADAICRESRAQSGRETVGGIGGSRRLPTSTFVQIG